jgi:carbamoyltransferase
LKILGISAYYHDSAAAIYVNGKLVGAAQEERFTRIKHDESFPINAVKYCLVESGLSVNNLDAVVFYDKPLLKFERLLETYYNFAPQGLKSFLLSIPVWINEKLFLKKLIKDELRKIEPKLKKDINLLFPEHHLSHAASTFYPSPYKEAAIITLDGVGEWATASICHGKGKDIKILKELKFPHSLGLLYSAFTYFLGFKVNSGEYKLMGLAPYGNPDSDGVKNYIAAIKKELIDIKPDGSVHLNQKYFSYATGLKMVKEKKWEKLFNMDKRQPESPLEQIHCNLGLAIQMITEEMVLLIAKEAKRLTGSDYLCMAGGVALNCVSNGKLQREGIFKEVFITPASGDAGGSLGAAAAAHHIYFGQERSLVSPDALEGSYLGPDYSDKEIESNFRKYKAVYTKHEDIDSTAQFTAKQIKHGKAIGWFQGRMEFGPRALGNRSILGDPTNEETQEKLNLKIKYRESFRPFAPSVLVEDAEEYFEMYGDSPYMLVVQPVQESRRKPLPANYNELEIRDKLYTLRSDIPAITHIDFSARIQTVSKHTNKKYWTLINAFKQESGYGMVVNTSFNVRGEPIVCTPEDAYKCFMRTEMDYLVVGNYVLKKEDQPEWTQKDNWQEEFKLD